MASEKTGKTHRVERRKQANRVTTVNQDDEPAPLEEKRNPVTLPRVKWTERPLPKTDKEPSK